MLNIFDVLDEDEPIRSSDRDFSDVTGSVDGEASLSGFTTAVALGTASISFIPPITAAGI